MQGRNDELAVHFERMLGMLLSPGGARTFDIARDFDTLWAKLEESGYLDIVTPEENGGVGLAMRDLEPLAYATGKRALALPICDTMVARLLISRARKTIPKGPIHLVSQGLFRNDSFAGTSGEHCLIERDGELLLMPGTLTTGTGAPEAGENSLGPAPADGLRPFAALIRSAMIAGASNSLLDLTILYANQRSQFGRPIAKQQVIQQQLAIMAEHCVSARIAAEIGFRASAFGRLEAIATAKAVTSSAAAKIAAIAHAIFGAIGISEECDVQLYTRCLHEWRVAAGSEAYWEEKLGAMRLSGPANSVYWMCETLPPA